MSVRSLHIANRAHISYILGVLKMRRSPMLFSTDSLLVESTQYCGNFEGLSRVPLVECRGQIETMAREVTGNLRVCHD